MGSPFSHRPSFSAPSSPSGRIIRPRPAVGQCNAAEKLLAEFNDVCNTACSSVHQVWRFERIVASVMLAYKVIHEEELSHARKAVSDLSDLLVIDTTTVVSGGVASFAASRATHKVGPDRCRRCSFSA